MWVKKFHALSIKGHWKFQRGLGGGLKQKSGKKDMQINGIIMSVLCLDYFMKEMGPFSEIFANLESMNRAVSNALVESAKVCITYW